MNKSGIIVKTISLFSIILCFHDAGSLPASSFIITPSGIKNSAYTGSRSVYRIVSSDQDFTLIGTANQKIISVKAENEISTVMISSGDYTVSEIGNRDSYLKNTPFLNLDAESIKKTASGFRNSKDPLSDVMVFVYNHISDKKTGIPLLPAAAVLQGKAGDCTEHTVLTVSILRSLNIPSRAVMGIILTESFSGRQNVFVYHMWAEAYFNGRWHLVDSTRPNDIHHNRYIALAYHNLMTETPIDYLRAISTIQDMKITFVR